MYLYDNKNLKFNKLKLKSILIWISPIILISMTFGYIISSVMTHPNPIEKLVFKDRLILLPETKLIMNDTILAEYLIANNIKFPAIVMAQALHESNRFTSDIYLENNNLFGMKKAYSRQSRATGVNRGHATYDNWEDSIIDYGYYQANYLRQVKTEAQYLLYLNKYYASDSLYDKNIKRYLVETKPYFTKK